MSGHYIRGFMVGVLNAYYTLALKKHNVRKKLVNHEKSRYLHANIPKSLRNEKRSNYQKVYKVY
jgi:hypothetical protein